MRVRFETSDNRLVEEVTFPHAELPLGDFVFIGRGDKRIRYAVHGATMLVDGGELKAVVTVEPAAETAH